MKAIHPFNKETHQQDKRDFDGIYRELHYIIRANDPSKLLANNTLIILINLVSMLRASQNKQVCVNQDFLREITSRESDQNSNLLKQLKKDIISYKHHQTAHFEGKRYNYCDTVEFTQEGKKRTSNAEQFYTADVRIKCQGIGGRA